MKPRDYETLIRALTPKQSGPYPDSQEPIHAGPWGAHTGPTGMQIGQYPTPPAMPQPRFDYPGPYPDPRTVDPIPSPRHPIRHEQEKERSVVDLFFVCFVAFMALAFVWGAMQ